jgi:hypothetical protein
MIQRSCCAMLALSLAAAACSGERGGDGGGGGPVDPTLDPPRLEMISGNGQPGLEGQQLAEPLIVRVWRYGLPLAGIQLTFTPSAGSMVSQTVATDRFGYAQAVWMLPTDAAAIAGARVAVRAAGGTDSLVFTARRITQAEMDVVIAEDGLPVTLLVYDRGGWVPGGYERLDFSDSVHVFFGNGFVRDEIAAFTPGRAPLLVPVDWTPGRDTVRLRVSTEVIRMPMTIWVVQPPFDSTAILVQRHLKGVADSWEAQAGIGLRDVRIVDATQFAGAAAFQGTTPGPCDAAIKSVVGWDEGRLNAYYTGQPPLGSAVYCNRGWMEIFPLAWERMPYTLAHEIGHGFLGLHHETIPDNVMHFRGDGTRFSHGQIFRAHYSNWSILNTMFSAHPGSVQRFCAVSPSTAAPVCPTTDFVLD